MVKTIISGGQVGADIAGLRAAKVLGLETGGWIPKGFKTLDGSKPEYAEMYGLVECTTDSYAVRTRRNVEDSDATIRFAENWTTPGEKCTLTAIEQFNKIYMDISIYGTYDEYRVYILPSYVRAWLNHNKVETLNIAGNARWEIEDTVERFIVEALR